MSESEPDSFDDPGLKAAIRRAWGAEQCPLSLRDRVMTLCKESFGATASPARIGWRGRRLYGLAAAAMVLIAVGVVFHFRAGAPQTHQTVVAALPAYLADELVARHDGCCAAKDHHMQGLSRDDFPTIQKQLRQQLGFPILAAKLPGTWDFHGAFICPVGSTKSGHLVFDQNGNNFVSIFSLPHEFASSAYLTGDCSQTENHHPIAAFATNDGFYCVVGSSKDGSLTLDQIRSLRDQLRPALAQARINSDRVTITALR
jgi:hypothetical protein